MDETLVPVSREPSRDVAPEYAKNVMRAKHDQHPENENGALGRRPMKGQERNARPYELAFSTVTARRFCDQQEMSLHTATGRSLP
jgi:hypothetical protein